MMQLEVWLAVVGGLAIGGLSVIWVPYKKHRDRTLLSAYSVFLCIVESVFLATLLALSLLWRGFYETPEVSGIAVVLFSLLSVVPAWEYGSRVISRSANRE